MGAAVVRTAALAGLTVPATSDPVNTAADITSAAAGNILTDADIADRLDMYPLARLRMGTNSTCHSCSAASQCGKGCPAAVVAAGEHIGAVDTEVCPVTTGTRRLLPVIPA
jgi:radical SAM protein with 4Fe4S-binding SPASM domain